MIKIVDEKTAKGVFTFHSTKCAEMYTVITSRDFIGGAVGGQMLGPGFYTNFYLKQAKKHKYGQFIFMTKILNTDKFLCIDAKMYKLMTGKDVKQDDEQWIKDQFVAAGAQLRTFSYKEPFLPPRQMEVYTEISRKIRRGDKPSSYSWPHWHKIKAAGFRGLIYSGEWDAESLVCWYIDDVIPIGISVDDAKTWVKPHTGLKVAMDQEDHDAMRDQNLKSDDEFKRSMQRAYDMQQRAIKDGWSEDQLVRHIKAQLSRLQNSDQYVLQIRIDAFITLFPNLEEKITG